MMRTHTCGELRAGDVGATVSLCGWVARRREHGEHLAFVDLRDRTGVVQCVVGGAHDLRAEYVVRVTGTVRARPEGTVNPDLPTGEVEVGDCTVEILNAAEPPPFPLSERPDRGDAQADENVRLRHRFVDLRRERMQRNLAVRADGQPLAPRRHGPPGLHRGRDADALDARPRRAPASSSSRRGSTRAPSTCCRRAPRSPSSC